MYIKNELIFFAGVAIGIKIGAATDNLGTGIGIGIAFGATFIQTKNEQKSTESGSSEKDVVIDLNQMNRRKRKVKINKEE